MSKKTPSRAARWKPTSFGKDGEHYYGIEVDLRVNI
jgi:hypothetical protein